MSLSSRRILFPPISFTPPPRRLADLRRRLDADGLNRADRRRLRFRLHQHRTGGKHRQREHVAVVRLGRSGPRRGGVSGDAGQ